PGPARGCPPVPPHTEAEFCRNSPPSASLLLPPAAHRPSRSGEAHHQTAYRLRTPAFSAPSAPAGVHLCLDTRPPATDAPDPVRSRRRGMPHSTRHRRASPCTPSPPTAESPPPAPRSPRPLTSPHAPGSARLPHPNGSRTSPLLSHSPATRC